MGPSKLLLRGALAVALLGAPATSLAADTCIHTTTATGWTFLFHKLKLKPGKSGVLDGYAVHDGDQLIEPISGGYLVFPSSTTIGITRYLTGLSPTGSGLTTFETSFHQIELGIEPTDTGTDFVWTRTPGGTFTDDTGTVAHVDCATVPKVPKVFVK